MYTHTHTHTHTELICTYSLYTMEKKIIFTLKYTAETNWFPFLVFAPDTKFKYKN